MLAHILPCVIELELMTLAAWLVEHAATIIACWRARF